MNVMVSKADTQRVDLNAQIFGFFDRKAMQHDEAIAKNLTEVCPFAAFV